MVKLYAVGDSIKAIPLDTLQNWQQIGNAPWMGDSDGAPSDPAVLAESVAFLFRSIRLRANAVASVPWTIGTQGKGKGATLWDSSEPSAPPALAYLTGLKELLYRTEASLCLSSRAYWYIERNRVKPTALRWLDPATMAAKWTPGGISHFDRAVNGRVVTLPPTDVIYIWQRSLSETEPDTPAAKAAANAAGVLYNLDSFERLFFERGAIKATLLTVDEQPLPEEKDALLTWWRRVASGIRNAFSTDIINASVKPIVIGEGVSELGNTTLTAEKREDIATALGVPHSMVSANAANYATARSDQENFYNTTVIPQCELVERQVNESFFAGLGLRFSFQPESLSVFQRDENERAAAFAAYVGAGLLPSVVVQLLGIQLPEGIEPADLDPAPAPPPPPVIVQAAPPQITMRPDEDEEGGDEDEEVEVERKRFIRWAKKRPNADPAAFASALLSLDERIALMGVGIDRPPFAGKRTPDTPHGDGADKQRTALEKKHTAALREAFAAYLRKVLPGNTGPNTISPESVAERLEKHKDILRDALYRMMFEAAMLGVDVGRQQVEKAMGITKASANVTTDVWDLVNADVVAWLIGVDVSDAAGVIRPVGRVTALMAQLIETTVAAAAPLVREWARNGQPLSDLQDQLLAAGFNETRARRIATTEVTRAYAEGNNQAWTASGVVDEKEWTTSADEKVCSVCGPLDERRVPLDEGFTDDIFNPPAHPQCRCWILPVMAASSLPAAPPAKPVTAAPLAPRLPDIPSLRFPTASTGR